MGIVDISAARGNPVTGGFPLAALTFQAKRASQGLGVGFSTEHTQGQRRLR